MRRAARLVAATMLAAATAAGCTQATTDPGRDTAQMNAIAAQIQAALAQRPDVTTARVVYQNNVEAPGMVTVTVTVHDTTDTEPVIDETLRRVWQSRLNPLSSVHVGVVHADPGQRGTVRDLNLLDKDQRAELDRLYGAHPAK